ncbi:MAG: transcriptional regulator [Oscillospiraceae bacterium]|nr:transcriptional regulator [Oscillospiraceae bacterium]
MLHNESRELLVEAYEKNHKAKQIGEAYLVSEWTVYRLAEQKRKTGSVALRVSQRGRKPKLTPENITAIGKSIEEKPDITIHDLNESLKLGVSDETVRRTVVALGYRVKKKMIHASEQERPRCAGEAKGMARVRTKSTSRKNAVS